MSEDCETFTSQMRKATREIHSLSDSLVNAKFALSMNDETVWAGGLLVFYHVFAFLEDAKERLNMPEFDALLTNRILYRKHCFEEDLEHYLGENWKDTRMPESVQNYLTHLKTLEKENPVLLLAYVYHIYMGLLSGGQILAKKKRIFGEKRNSNYCDRVTDFTGYDIPQLKKDFRKAMNDIADKMTEEQKQRFIVESNQVFLLNNTIVKFVEGQNKAIRSILYKYGLIAVIIISAVIALNMKKNK